MAAAARKLLRCGRQAVRPERAARGPRPVWRAAALCAACLFVAAACGPPVGVARLDPREVHRTLAGNVLSTDEPSVESRIVLQRRGLASRYADDPPAALADLHRIVATGEGGPDELFALAELSFHHAERGGGRAYHLAAASSPGRWAEMVNDLSNDADASLSEGSLR